MSQRVLPLLAGLLLFGIAPARADSAPDLAARIDAYVRPYLEFDTFSGVILVAKGDRPVFQKGYGFANAEFEIPNTPQTRFPVASITKRFTAVILQRLFAETRLSPDDLLAKWVPDFPAADRITVAHLMSHRSGLRDPEQLRGILRRSSTSAEVVEMLKSSPIASAPGEVYSYTTANYAILGHIIERVTGKSYAQVVDETVYAPAGMKDSGELTTATVVPRLASGYTPDPAGRGLAVCGPEDTSWKVAGGSSYSTAPDLARFSRALYDGTLLPSELAARAFPFSTTGGRRVLASSGSFPGASANLLFFPDDDVTVVVLSNNSASVPGAIADAVARMQFGEAVAPPSIRLAASPHAIDPRALGAYAVAGRPWTFRIELREARPVLAWTPLRQGALLRVSEDTWFEPFDWALLKLRFDAAGGLVEGTFTLPGQDPLAIVRR